MRENTKRTRYGVAALIASIALMTPIRAQERPQRGLSEGIKVHGHWTIDVRNPDGSLVSHREFENSLADNGPQFLAGLLNNEWTMGTWAVGLDGPGGTPLCRTSQDLPSECRMFEAIDQQAAHMGPELGKSVFANLVRTVPHLGFYAEGTIQLDGYVQITNTSASMSIGRVATYALACFGGSWNPRDCRADDVSRPFLRFTTHSLGTPIPVTAMQIVQVTVVLSFS